MVLIGVNPEEDNLDRDVTGERKANRNKHARASVQHNKIGHDKHDKHGRTKTRAISQESNKNPKMPTTPKTPRRNKITVANRLLNSSQNFPMLASPTESDNVYFNLGTEPARPRDPTQAQRDLEVAEQMLIHAQQEAERARRRIREQDAHITGRDHDSKAKKNNEKKEEKTGSRYDNEKKGSEKGKSKDKLPDGPYDNTSNSTSAKYIDTVKNNVKLLNPLRRARGVHTSHTGENNPNVPGQDNGLNAWMDATLNSEHTDEQLRYETRYAKKNSDLNRCFDIDDIPIRGPPS